MGPAAEEAGKQVGPDVRSDILHQEISFGPKETIGRLRFFEILQRLKSTRLHEKAKVHGALSQ